MLTDRHAWGAREGETDGQSGGQADVARRLFWTFSSGVA
jgi:hypothetical protein